MHTHTHNGFITLEFRLQGIATIYLNCETIKLLLETKEKLSFLPLAL